MKDGEEVNLTERGLIEFLSDNETLMDLVRYGMNLATYAWIENGCQTREEMQS